MAFLRDLKHSTWDALRELRKNLDSEKPQFWGVQQAAAFNRAILVFEASTLEQDIEQAWKKSGVDKSRIDVMGKERSCHPLAAKWLLACESFGLTINNSIASENRRNRYRALSHEHWISALFAMRNQILHVSESYPKDRVHLDRLEGAGLSSDPDGLTKEFFDESERRWAQMLPSFQEIARKLR